MSEPVSIQVNFGRPMPLFPLPQVVLLPQQVVPLHIFEPRYRQMVEHALDGAGQIAMAVYAGIPGRGGVGQAIRPAVCIAQIAQHERRDDGCYDIVVQGVCRAKIAAEAPAQPGVLYRSAMLEPVGLDHAIAGEDLDAMDDEARSVKPPPTSEELERARSVVREMLEDGPLSRLRAADPVLEYVGNGDLPTVAVMELVSFTLVSDQRVKYRLLAEGRAERRAGLILSELRHLSQLIDRAGAQHPEEWPKGCSWN